MVGSSLQKPQGNPSLSGGVPILQATTIILERLPIHLSAGGNIISCVLYAEQFRWEAAGDHPVLWGGDAGHLSDCLSDWRVSLSGGVARPGHPLRPGPQEPNLQPDRHHPSLLHPHNLQPHQRDHGLSLRLHRFHAPPTPLHLHALLLRQHQKSPQLPPRPRDIGLRVDVRWVFP